MLPPSLEYCHWYAVVGDASPLSSHDPVPAVRVLPILAVPETVGGTVFVGGAVTKLEVHVDDAVDEFPAVSVAAPAATSTVKVPLDGEPELTLKV